MNTDRIYICVCVYQWIHKACKYMHTIHVQALRVLFCNPFVLHKHFLFSFISACQAGAMLVHSLQKESRKQFTHAVIYTLTHMPTLFMMTQTQNASVHGSVFVTFIYVMSRPSKLAYKYILITAAGGFVVVVL